MNGKGGCGNRRADWPQQPGGLQNNRARSPASTSSASSTPQRRAASSETSSKRNSIRSSAERGGIVASDLNAYMNQVDEFLVQNGISGGDVGSSLTDQELEENMRHGGDQGAMNGDIRGELAATDDAIARRIQETQEALQLFQQRHDHVLSMQRDVESKLTAAHNAHSQYKALTSLASGPKLSDFLANIRSTAAEYKRLSEDNNGDVLSRSSTHSASPARVGSSGEGTVGGAAGALSNGVLQQRRDSSSTTGVECPDDEMRRVLESRVLELESRRRRADALIRQLERLKNLSGDEIVTNVINTGASSRESSVGANGSASDQELVQLTSNMTDQLRQFETLQRQLLQLKQMATEEPVSDDNKMMSFPPTRRRYEAEGRANEDADLSSKQNTSRRMTSTNQSASFSSPTNQRPVTITGGGAYGSSANHMFAGSANDTAAVGINRGSDFCQGEDTAASTEQLRNVMVGAQAMLEQLQGGNALVGGIDAPNASRVSRLAQINRELEQITRMLPEAFAAEENRVAVAAERTNKNLNVPTKSASTSTRQERNSVSDLRPPPPPAAAAASSSSLLKMMTSSSVSGSGSLTGSNKRMSSSRPRPTHSYNLPAAVSGQQRNPPAPLLLSQFLPSSSQQRNVSCQPGAASSGVNMGYGPWGLTVPMSGNSSGGGHNAPPSFAAATWGDEDTDDADVQDDEEESGAFDLEEDEEQQTPSDDDEDDDVETAPLVDDCSAVPNVAHQPRGGPTMVAAAPGGGGICRAPQQAVASALNLGDSAASTAGTSRGSANNGTRRHRQQRSNRTRFVSSVSGSDWRTQNVQQRLMLQTSQLYQAMLNDYQSNLMCSPMGHAPVTAGSSEDVASMQQKQQLFTSLSHCYHLMSLQQMEINNLQLALQQLQMSQNGSVLNPSGGDQWRIRPPSVLNNQVEPGMRSNNYFDNFRSYSTQNHLSGNTSPLPQATTGGVAGGHNSRRTVAGKTQNSVSTARRRNRVSGEALEFVRNSLQAEVSRLVEGTVDVGVLVRALEQLRETRESAVDGATIAASGGAAGGGSSKRKMPLTPSKHNNTSRATNSSTLIGGSVVANNAGNDTVRIHTPVSSASDIQFVFPAADNSGYQPEVTVVGVSGDAGPSSVSRSDKRRSVSSGDLEATLNTIRAIIRSHSEAVFTPDLQSDICAAIGQGLELSRPVRQRLMRTVQPFLNQFIGRAVQEAVVIAGVAQLILQELSSSASAASLPSVTSGADFSVPLVLPPFTEQPQSLVQQLSAAGVVDGSCSAAAEQQLRRNSSSQERTHTVQEQQHFLQQPTHHHHRDQQQQQLLRSPEVSQAADEGIEMSDANDAPEDELSPSGSDLRDRDLLLPDQAGMGDLVEADQNVGVGAVANVASVESERVESEAVESAGAILVGAGNSGDRAVIGAESFDQRDQSMAQGRAANEGRQEAPEGHVGSDATTRCTDV